MTSQCFLSVRTADWIQLSYQAPGLPAPCQNIQPSCLATGPVPSPAPHRPSPKERAFLTKANKGTASQGS